MAAVGVDILLPLRLLGFGCDFPFMHTFSSARLGSLKELLAESQFVKSAPMA